MATETKWPALCDDIRQDILKGLETMHLFHVAPKGFLTKQQLLAVAEATAIVEMPHATVVQKERSVVDAVYYVLDGRLSKFHGKDVVETIARGGQIGQLHMICSDQASSTVLVESDHALCVSLQRKALDDILLADTELLRAVTSNLSRALRSHVRRSQSARLVRLVEHLNAEAPEVFDDDADSDKQMQKYKTLLAAISGLASMTLAFPLDVARTKLQTEGRGDIMHGLGVVVKMATQEGIGACYKGWASSAVQHTVQNASYHSAYDKLVAVFKGEGTSALSDVTRLTLGVVAGCYAGVIVNPLNTISYRLQGKGGEDYGPLGMLVKIVREEGFFSLWNGMGPTLLLSINPCITFYLFDELKCKYLRRKQEKEGDLTPKLTPFETLVIGAMAKATASALTFPLLMAKIRMGLFGKAKYPSLLMTFAIVLREEGWGGMFKGVGLSLLRSVLVASLEFMLRDKLQEIMSSQISKKARKVKADRQ